MRVLALARRYGPDPGRGAGAEAHLHDLLRALAARGHTVDVVLSRQYGARYRLDGVTVHQTQDLQRQTMGLLPGADVLVTHLENTPRATTLGRLNSKPVVVVHHNTFDPCREALVGFGRVDLVAANSVWVAKDLAGWVSWRGAQPAKTIVVRPIPDRTEYMTTPGDRVTLINCRKYDPLDGSEGTISKGGELLAAVAERMPDVGFLAVWGAYGTQQTYDGLPNVEVVGPYARHDMREQVYQRTRVLIVPSSYESWGRVGCEAMVSGIPVVAAPTPGLQESLGQAGLYASSEDPEEWVGLIRHALDPTEWAALSAASLDRARRLDARRDIELERWTHAVEHLVAQEAAPCGL